METSAVSKTRTSERRRFPRWQWDTRLHGIHVDSDGKCTVETIQTVDVSKGGLGAITPHEHEVGQHFVIGLPEPSGRLRYVHAKIVRCWNDTIGRHVGMEFSDLPVDLGHWMNQRLAA